MDTARNDQVSSEGKGPGALSRWVQRRMNARMSTKIHKGKSQMMGMDVLVLHNVGRTSGEPRETPLAWFADGDDARLVVASGGGDRNPDWYTNLVTHPGKLSIALPGAEPVPVTPETLEGAAREKAWRQIAEAQPRIAKYQSKSAREYPIVRLTPR
jgi:deazaflavin-dependent oxidoreductase (nitroreductase family)